MNMNQINRWYKIERLKLKIQTLPVIKNIIVWYYSYKMYRNLKGKSSWDQYVATKEFENRSKEICFAARLLRLKLCIDTETNSVTEFYEVKEEVLSSDLIKEAKYDEFREWVQRLSIYDVDEIDSSKIDELDIMRSFFNQQNN